MIQLEYGGIANVIMRNNWEDNPILQYKQFTITQFKSTAFDSNYQCYKVSWKEWERNGSVFLGNSVHRGIVFKITNKTEMSVLQLLSTRKIPAPAILARMRCKQDEVMLFESLLPGVELYGNMENDVWCLAAKALFVIHMEFWDAPNREQEIARQFPANDAIKEKLYRASLHTSHKPLWQCYMREIMKRLENMPTTLIHGDMFPTNILIDHNDVRFIDWEDSCIFAYAFDIAQLTATIDVRTLQPMCPCPDKVISTYFEMIKDVVHMDFAEYLLDIQMAQFVEIASNYSPPGCYAEKEYNCVLENELNRIAAAYYSR